MTIIIRHGRPNSHRHTVAERLDNDIGDLGNICAGTGLATGSSQGARL